MQCFNSCQVTEVESSEVEISGLESSGLESSGLESSGVESSGWSLVRKWKYCDGWIDFPWLNPNDEANCTGFRWDNKRCSCNHPRNFTFEFDSSI